MNFNVRNKLVKVPLAARNFKPAETCYFMEKRDGSTMLAAIVAKLCLQSFLKAFFLSFNQQRA